MAGELIEFSKIVGQDAAIRTLTTALRANRLPHGMIFAGPVGVGKETTARALAGVFLCERPNNLSPCGTCASCRVFDAGNHPDYHIIYRQLARIENDKLKARDLTADVVRDYLVAKAANKTVVGVGKVFVVREAELMNPQAQNALLKTLEEPAGRTLIILLTDRPDDLLPTIHSRCQTIRFGPLDENIVRAQLQQRNIDAAQAAAAATFASGSIGLALKWIADGVIARAAELSMLLDRIIAGQSAEPLRDLLKAASEAYAAAQLEVDEKASKDQATREGFVLYFKLATEHLRRRMAKSSDDSETLERLCAAVDALVQSELFVDSNVNTPLVLQELAVSLDSIFAQKSGLIV